MEPERKVEKLLRAYAKKRSAEGGDAFKLHPATRRLLQGEIARRKSKTGADEDEVSPTLWTLFRQRLAFVLSVVFILFISAALILPSLSSAKRKAQSIVTLNNLKQIGVAAKMNAEANEGQLPMSLDALTNGLVADKVLIDPQSGERFAYLGDGKNLSNLQPDTVLAYSTEDKKGRAVLLADGSVTYARREQFAELMNHDQSDLARADDSARRQLGTVSAPMVAASKPVELAKSETRAANLKAINRIAEEPAGRPLEITSAKEKSLGKSASGVIAGTDFGITSNTFALAGANSAARDRSKLDMLLTPPSTSLGPPQSGFGGAQKFVQATVGNAQNAFKNIAVPSQKVPVLASFQVEQNGTAISMMDADGSVYQGSFDAETVVAQNQPVPADMPSAPAVSPQIQAKDALVQNYQKAVQNNSFRVSGLNQTLKQKVVFTGNLLSISQSSQIPQQNSVNGYLGGTGGGGGGAGGQSQLSDASRLQAEFWANARITGTAVIDKTNLVEINAVPLLTSPP